LTKTTLFFIKQIFYLYGVDLEYYPSGLCRVHFNETEMAQVEGRTKYFFVVMIGKYLKLLVDDPLINDMHGITKQQHNELFNGEVSYTPKGCQLDNAKF
jgi:hypothetical protein